LLVIDIDDKDQNNSIPEIRSRLCEIPEVLAIHSSLGGLGLAVYFRINRARHAESFEAITKMLINDYQIIPDMHCGNVARLRFVSYDPDCHLNYGASVWTQLEKKQPKQEQEYQYEHHIFSENDIDYILQQVQAQHINIAPDYYSWLRIGFGLASKLGESGRKVFETISQYYSDKQKINPKKQYDRCLKSDANKRSGTSIRSFFYYAKLAGCNITSDRTNKIKTIAKIRRKQESSGSGAMTNGKSDARQYLTEFEGITGSDVDQVLNQVWQAPASELKDDKDSLLHNIEVFLKSNYKFRLNDITKVVEVNGEPLNDYLFNSIYLKASRVVSEKINKEKIKDLINSDFTPRYNPLHEWFEKNKGIHTTGNITKLAKCIDSNLKLRDPFFVEYFLEKWLLGMIASAFGTYSILCLVLTGQQHGTYKTNFFRFLLPEILRWLIAKSRLDSKEADVAYLMCRKWLIYDDEFGGKSKQDEKKFKDMVGTDIFSVRMPYAHFSDDYQRLAVLCGTSNEDHILNDLTGNRRIIPIQVNFIDEVKYAEIDKTELFIELYHKYKADPKGWFLNKEDIERLNDVCYDARQVAPEMELPLKYFKKAASTEPGSKFVSSSEIRSKIEQSSGIRLSQQKLSVALKNIGFESGFKRIDNVGLRGFWVYEIGQNFSNNIEDNEEKVPF
jgi:predicted P-loop ATPase